MLEAGLLDEHQPRDSDVGGPTEYTPTPEERKLIKLVDTLFEKAKRARSLYDTDWLDNYHLFRGKQWKEQRPSYRHSEVINFIFRTIQSVVPMQVDARPRFEFLPEEPSDYELSIILNEVAEADWQKDNSQEQLLEVVYDGNLYGTGLSDLCQDPKANHKLGKVVYQSVDPFTCFPDPNARDVNRECGYFVVAEPKDVNKIKREYPEFKEFIKADLVDLMKGSKTDFTPMKFRSPIDRRVASEGNQSIDNVDKDKALVLTCYMTPEFCEDDFEEIEKTLKDPAGTESQVFEQRARWPKGRKVVTCNGVLLDGESELYDDVKIPLQRYVNYLMPREFWGMSEVEQLKGPQRMFNKVFCFALDVLTLTGNPIWINPLTSGVDSDNLVNRPGVVVEPNDEKSAPYRVEGGQLQPYVLQIADRLAEYVDTVSGRPEVSQGIQPSGVTAASAITALQDAANTRVRLKSKLLDGYLQQVGQAWLSRTLQYRTAPEIHRLTNNEGASRYFRMHVEHYEKTDEQGQPTGERGTRVHHQPLTAEGMDPEAGRSYEIRGKFDVRVSTGSSLPFNKAAKEERLFKLYETGVIDEEELLKGLEYPNWQAVVQRMAQRKAQEAAAQAGAGAPGQPAAA